MDLNGILKGNVSDVRSISLLTMMMGLMMRKGREHILCEHVYGGSKGEDGGKSRGSDSVCLIIRTHKVKHKIHLQGKLDFAFLCTSFENWSDYGDEGL